MSILIRRMVEAAFILALVWVCLTLSGCHTINGLGQDLQSATSPYIQE